MVWPETTYDGLPIARDKPFGACIVVYREEANGREVLLLHRGHEGPGFEGDWAWTPPSGSRLPGEDVLLCAQRELLEETGLVLELFRVPALNLHFALFVALAESGCEVLLNDEHDRFEWLTVTEAVRRCAPPVVAEEIELALAYLTGTPSSQ